jgi:hypothetical protein
MITEAERRNAIRLLERSRKTLLDAIKGVTDEQARMKSSGERWSILEYVEHLAISDDGLVAMIKKSLREPATPETPDERQSREQKIKSTEVPRGANKAPERLRPTARFASLAEARDAFLAARERTLEFARTTQDNLRDHFTPHGVLGPLDGYQWLMGNARHAETHAEHIREIVAGFGVRY